MADGRGLEKRDKLLYLSNGLTDYDEILQVGAHWPSGPLRAVRNVLADRKYALKILNGNNWLHRVLIW